VPKTLISKKELRGLARTRNVQGKFFVEENFPREINNRKRTSEILTQCPKD